MEQFLSGNIGEAVGDILPDFSIESVAPSDSVSQAGSRKSNRSTRSSVASSKVKVMAAKAAAKARLASLEKQHCLKRKQMELLQMEEKLRAEEEINVLEAEEHIYVEFEKSKASNRRKTAKPQLMVIDTTGSCMSKLNPTAEEWSPIVNEGLHTPLNDHSQDSQRKKETLNNSNLEHHFQSSQLTNNDATDQWSPVVTKTPLAHSNEHKDSYRDTIPETCGKYAQNNEYPSYISQYNPSNHTGVRQGETVTANQDRSLWLQEQMVHMMQLPKSEMIHFDGDPLKYWMFIRAFDNSVGMTPVSDCVKLNRLLQYCTGKARDIIECCSVMDPSVGYGEARRLLAQRFGNQFTIAQVWTKRITEGPQIKPADVEGLQRYSDDVKSCVITLKAIGRISEVDNQIRMSKIVNRLPFYLQSSWRREAVKELKRIGQYPDICQLMDFIEVAAEEASDPVFGSHANKEIRENKFKHQDKVITGKSKSASFIVSATDTETTDKSRTFPPCHMCSGEHVLYKCERFRKMKPEERIGFTRSKRLCFNCFSPKHLANECEKPYECPVRGCAKKHSKLLHLWSDKPNKDAHTAEHPNNPAVKSQTSQVQVCSSSCEVTGAGVTRVALPVVPVKVRANSGQRFITTYALLDSGSTNTFCSTALLSQLGANGIQTKLSLTTLNKEDNDSDVTLTSLEVADISERKVIQLPHVFSASKLPALRDNVAIQGDVDQWAHLQGIKIPFIDKTKVMILIGQDVPEALVPTEVRRGQANQPYATRTMFGWTINGPLGVGERCNSAVSNFVKADRDLHQQIENFWKLTTSESLSDDKTQMSRNDKKVTDIWNKTTKVFEGHYEMKIPFKHSPPDLPNNYSVAESRLESLGRRLHKNPTLFERYDAEIKALVDKGFAEKVEDPSEGIKRKIWYLPHDAVMNEKKPEKLRVVFDCAAKFNGTSLNDEVLQGPDLTNKLVGVLLRFRQEQVAVMGDVTAMFHQIKVFPEDRDVLRFLWWSGDINGGSDVYRMTVHLFGGVWCPSCATFALRRTAEDQADDFDPEVVQTVLDNFYVDDCLKSVATEEKVVTLVQELCKLLQKRGFILNKWTSNSRKVLDSIPVQQRAKGVQDLNLEKGTLPTERALGIQWNTETDELGIRAQNKSKPMTRRGLISVISSIYDPLGFVCPFILQAKKIFQDETRSKKSWDKPLNLENEQRWTKWVQDIPKLEQFKVSRCILPGDFGKVVTQELHHFSDASMNGYGAVSYLRAVNSEGRVHCSLLTGKSRLAPIKQITVPRLELSAAVISVKLDRSLRRELRMEIQESTFWTDSTIVLQYLRNERKRFHTFVANRISLILDGSSAVQWRHVASKLNPADDASRGLNADQMVENERWKHGPGFLWEEKSTWPTTDVDGNLPHCDAEVKEDVKVFVSVDETTDPASKLIERYSSWYRLKKAVSWLMRVKNYLQRKVKDKHVAMVKGPLTVIETENAERVLIKAVQQRCFTSEMKTLESGKPLKPSSTIIKLEPMLNSNGVLCIGGRLHSAPVHQDSKFQPILPKDHRIATLIARDLHEASGHSGKEHVLARIRESFWIIRGRVTVKKVLRDCVHCRRLQAKPSVQRMADLPEERVSPGYPPFSFVGVDYFGPFMVRRGRSELKRYGFTNLFFGLASLNTLCGIAVARYFTVVPQKTDFKFNIRQSIWLIVIGWVWALIWAILPLTGWTKYTLEGARTSCSILWRSDDNKVLSYVICLFLFGFVLPTFLMVYCYVCIYRAMRTRSGASLLNSAAQRKIYIRQTKVLRLIVGLTVTYFVTWLPYTIVAVICTIGNYKYLSTESVVLPSMFAKTSTVWNPIVYGLLNSRFRNSYREMFRKFGLCRGSKMKMTEYEMDTLTTAENQCLSVHPRLMPNIKGSRITGSGCGKLGVTDVCHIVQQNCSE